MVKTSGQSIYKIDYLIHKTGTFIITSMFALWDEHGQTMFNDG